MMTTWDWRRQITIAEYLCCTTRLYYTAVENRRLVNNNNVIHRILSTLKLYIIYIYTHKIRTYCCDGTHPYVTTTNVVIFIIIMSYALRRRVNILQLWKPVVLCGRVRRRFRGGCRRQRQWWLLHNDLDRRSYLMYMLTYIYILVYKRIHIILLI